MKWTDPMPPNNFVEYDHVTCNTPLGQLSIEWKSWKEDDTYDILLDDTYIDFGDNLSHAKDLAYKYLDKKREELTEFLK